MDFNAARAALVRELRRDVRDERVLAAIAKVPRERFVPELRRDMAYFNQALPIGYGQTISQPLMVALAVEALLLTGSERVLDVGTGSGYQAAVLAELVKYVVTVERIQELAAGAKMVLDQLGYGNVEVHVSGDRLGWPAGAPYDAIIVAAAAPAVGQDLLDQLADGGRLVLPVGPRGEQQLVRVRMRNGQIIRDELGACMFVPLIGRQAWPENNTL